MLKKECLMIRQRIQLGLVHVAVAMTLVPINSTLNRVMIKEMAISATLVAVLASLPYLFSPLQVIIGSFSDRHPLFNRRRTPYILAGLALCVLGISLSPYAAFILDQNLWLGILTGMVVFGMWGMGYNLSAVSYLSLASELSGEKGRGRTIAVMWFMMITGIIVTAIGLSHMVDPYTPQALERAFQAVGVAAFGLGLLGVIGLEPPANRIRFTGGENYTWGQMFRTILKNRQAKLFFWYLVILLAAILGQDLILEPFGAQAFGMSVKATTRITSLWGSCVLVALAIAGMTETRFGKRKVAYWGGWLTLAGFCWILLSGFVGNLGVFYLGVSLLGIGTGLATVSNLSLMLDMTTPADVGLYIGAWGMANALSRLIGTLLSGAVRDVVTQVTQAALSGYLVVFAIEASFIAVSLWMLSRIDVSKFQRQTSAAPLVERAAMAGEM
jgi:BCD family chlorophyll transporter-like MFS transporter